MTNETPENTEVLGNSGYLYKSSSTEGLAEKLKSALELTSISRPTSHRVELAVKARQRAVQSYSWNGVVDQYERLAGKILEK